MKLICAMLLFMFVMAAIKSPVEDALKEYRHHRIVSECKKNANVPSWMYSVRNYGCEHWAD